MARLKRRRPTGWDDAPLVTVPVGDVAYPLTIIMPFYRNPQFLRSHIERWAARPEKLKQHLSAIIVDDGSPEDTAQDALAGLTMPFPLRLFRIEEDRRWNWLAARNIAFMHAPEGWVLATDMDHVAPAETLELLIHGKHNPAIIYRFSRAEHTGEELKPHPNSFAITRSMFWKVGGYDEALSGHYGSDGDWRRRCAATAPIRTLHEKLIRHEYVGDSSTTHYKRKQPEDAGVKAIIATRGKGWRPKVLSFPYTEVIL